MLVLFLYTGELSEVRFVAISLVYYKSSVGIDIAVVDITVGSYYLFSIFQIKALFLNLPFKIL